MAEGVVKWHYRRELLRLVRRPLVVSIPIVLFLTLRIPSLLFIIPPFHPLHLLLLLRVCFLLQKFLLLSRYPQGHLHLPTPTLILAILTISTRSVFRSSV